MTTLLENKNLVQMYLFPFLLYVKLEETNFFCVIYHKKKALIYKI